MKRKTIFDRDSSLVRGLAAGAGLAGWLGTALAGTTDVSQTPLPTITSTPVKPNVMFIIDDSGSMADEQTYKGWVTYPVPVDESGSSPASSFPDFSDVPNFSHVKTPDTLKGAGSTANLVDLGLKWAYNAAAACTKATYSYTNPDTSETVTRSCTAEAINIARFAAYYGTRMLALKSASSLAFAGLNDQFRVGQLTINNKFDNSFLPVAEFAGTARTTWYSQLFSQGANGCTPLRSALAEAGRYFAGNHAATKGVGDPVQYSCQRNYAILFTDGEWNCDDDIPDLDGSKLGDVDAAADRPYYGGSSTSSSSSSSSRRRGWGWGWSWGGGGGGSSSSSSSSFVPSLADVALYYYSTDLRTSAHNPTGALSKDVISNNVPISGKDTATHQHMTTYTVGMDISGSLDYCPNYDETDPAPKCDTYSKLTSGSKVWGTNKVDDLWHAAVNGRGTYYNVSDAQALRQGLQRALTQISEAGAGSGAAVSNPVIQSGDAYSFETSYRTSSWIGDLVRRSLDPDTGEPYSDVDWSAQALINAAVTASGDSRKIYTFQDSASPTSNKLREFLWSKLNSTEQSLFDPTKIGHYSSLSAAQKSNLSCSGCGEKLVNYLRGQYGNEMESNTSVVADGRATALFRKRVARLGDIVGSSTLVVRAPQYDYDDTGYRTFKSNKASRATTVYVGSNDGLLHAFKASDGSELWAYAPSLLFADLYRLADKSYASNHRYYVDGKLATGDIYDGSNWRTILVAGMGAGGRGYVAVDITDPANPKGMWEVGVGTTCQPTSSIPADTVTDCDIGYSVGKPVISKRGDGKWVVLFTSGINNVSPGTGGGFLYAVDAVTGAILNKVPTLSGSANVGGTDTPSGLGPVSVRTADPVKNNSIVGVYGGDQLGYVWRFDKDGAFPAAGVKATNLARLTNPSKDPQPVTTAPEIGLYNEKPLLFFGTGRYLGTSDIGSTPVQSIWAFKDPMTDAGLGTLRSNADMQQKTIATTTDGERRVDSTTVDLGTKAGWYVDLADPTSSRIVVDPVLDVGVVGFAVNVPNENGACEAGGKSYFLSIDFTTGAGSILEGGAGKLTDSLISSIQLVKIGNDYHWRVTYFDPAKPPALFKQPFSIPVAPGRVSWREIAN